MAQTEPVLRCISLDANDDVTLLWEQPSDTGADFNAYLIYQKTGGIPSILSQVTDFNQTSVLINGSFAGAVQFYMVQVYNGFADTSAALDTISPMVIGISSLGKRVSLGWNHTGLASQDSVYRVFKRDTAGNWILMRTLEYPHTALLDTIGACTEEVSYRVETKGKGGCISRSNQVSKVIVDQEPPRRTNLQCASVDTATGYVDLEWFASRSADTYGYLIFYFPDFVRSDTSFGGALLNAQYTDFGIDAQIRPETLSVAPFDSCFDSTNMWYNQAADSLRFTTLFIDTIDFERCYGKLAIKWSHPDAEYALGVRRLGGFAVYRKSFGVSTQIALLSASDSIFIDSGLMSGTKYTYVVTAIDANTGKEAMSNKLVIDLKQKKLPKFFYVSSVKNDHRSGINRVHLLADSTAETATYGLFRAMPFSDAFMLVERVSADQRQQFFIADGSGRADQSAYQYQVAAYDGCGAIIAQTQIVQSIHVQADKNLRDLINTVRWTHYIGFDTLGDGLLDYEVHRTTTGDSGVFLASYGRPVKHTDDIAYLNDLGGEVCYYIAAPEDGENSFGLQDTAISNLICLDFPAISYVPNAFSPDGDGINDVFTPYVNFIDQQQYQLVIYNRIGQMVFDSTNPDEGWDGKHMPVGTYAFHLSLINVHGEVVEEAGKIHLIR